MKQFQKVQWIVLVAILVMGIAGCGFLGDDNNPTAPGGLPSQHANFFVSGGIFPEIGIYSGNEFFMVNVLMGDWLLMYTTNWGTFNIVFRATEATLLTVGLVPDDEVEEASIQKGTIADTAEAVQEDGAVTLFSLPDQQNSEPLDPDQEPLDPDQEPLDDIFVEDPVVPVIILISGGQVVQSATVVILPEPAQPDPEEPEAGDGAEESGQTYTITASVEGGGGSIKPSGAVTRPEGSSHVVQIIPDTGYSIDDVKVDGESVTVDDLGNGKGQYKFHKIAADHTIVATFTQ
jgi:hypothetical protein